MEPFRAAHVGLLVRQHRRVAKLNAALAADISEAVQLACPGDEYTALCHARMRLELDRIWARYYGMFPNDPRALWLATILANTRDAYETGVRLCRIVISRHLSRFDPEVLRALKEMANDSDAGAAR